MIDRVDLAANGCDKSESDNLGPTSNHMPIGHAFCAHPLDRNIDRKDVLEERWSFVVARAVNTGPSIQRGSGIGSLLGKDRPAAVAEQGVFGLFHVDEKRREVNDASSVGFSELDASFPGKNRRATRQHRA